MGILLSIQVAANFANCRTFVTFQFEGREHDAGAKEGGGGEHPGGEGEQPVERGAGKGKQNRISNLCLNQMVNS